MADFGVLSVVWGCSFVVLQRVVQGFGWAGAASFRALIAGFILLAVAAATRRKLNFGPSWRPFAVVGATTVAGQMVGMSFAVPRIGTAMAAIFVGAMPLFTMVIARLWGLERITSQGQLGLVLGFGGIVLLVGFPAVPVTGSFVLGCAAALAGSVSAAFGSNYARRKLAGTGSYEVTTGSFLFGGLMALPLLVLVPVPGLPSASAFGYLLTLAAMMSALAYVLFFRLVAELGATRAMSVEFFVTAVAVTIGSVVQHERLSAAQVAGAAVIIAGCALVLGLIPALSRRDRTGADGPPAEAARSERSGRSGPPAPVAQDP